MWKTPGKAFFCVWLVVSFNSVNLGDLWVASLAPKRELSRPVVCRPTCAISHRLTGLSQWVGKDLGRPSCSCLSFGSSVPLCQFASSRLLWWERKKWAVCYSKMWLIDEFGEGPYATSAKNDNWFQWFNFRLLYPLYFLQWIELN